MSAIFLLLSIPWAACADKIKITEDNLGAFELVGSIQRLACHLSDKTLGTISRKQVEIGAVFTPLDFGLRQKRLKTQLKALRKSTSAKVRKKRKLLRRKISELTQAHTYCSNFADSSSSSSNSYSSSPPPEPCFNGIQDSGEVGVDCEGTCTASCNPFREEFITQDRLSNLQDAALDGQGNIIPTHTLEHQELLSDSSTRLLYHLNRDPAVGENDMNVYDWSGFEHTGRISGATFESEDGLENHGSYLKFLSLSDKISALGIGSSFDLNQGLTISAWVRNEGFADNKDSYVWDFGASRNIRFLQNTGTLRLCVKSSYCRNYTDVFSEHVWQHLLVTIQGTVWSVFVDGQLKGQTDGGVSLADFGSSFGVTIGSAGQNGLSKLSIDEVAVWNAVLSDTQVLAVFNGRRDTGSFESTRIETPLPVYFLTARWQQSGFPIQLQVSADKLNWCELSNAETAEYFNCGFPARQFFYKVDFLGQASLDSLELGWSSIPAPCPDIDADGFDNWDGQYPHCTDDGRERDCDDNNSYLRPSNQNAYCNCSDTDGTPKPQYESYFAGHCRDGTDNDCDGLIDYDDADCAEDPVSWENLKPKFTGIDLSVQGSKFHDYAYERLWHDTQSDDDIVLYIKSDSTLLEFSHNENNLKGGGLLASSASLVDRDLITGLQARESVRVEVKTPVMRAKRNELDIKLTVVEHPTSFDLIVDDLTTPQEDERFPGLTPTTLKDIKSALVDLRYTGSALMREIDLPRAQEQRIHSGDILYRIDGDELRTGSRYDYTTGAVDGGTGSEPSPTSPVFEAMLADPDLLFFRSNGPFSLVPVKGRIGDNGEPLYDPDRLHYGMLDEFGDEWHTLTFWDNDWATNWLWDRRDDGSSDGKIIYVVLDPQTPAISFEAPEGHEFYTTPPKTYYTPHIFSQMTYLTSGVVISLHNITNSEPVYYQVDSGPWQRYSAPISAASIFGQADTEYRLKYRNGQTGPVRTRKIHYEPAQPAASETHPRLVFPNEAAMIAERAAVHGGNPTLTQEYEHHLRYYIQVNTTDFRHGTRSLGYDENTGYFYLTKTLTGTALDFAYFGAMEQSDEIFKKAKEALLFLYTVDPIACENGKGRAGGPSQERCMYSDGRVVPSLPKAYDLLFQYTRENGYEHGMTPIEHRKIRDNLANEAAILLKYPHTHPENFWTTQHFDHNSVRNFELETTYSGIALAMPSYDSEYYGTSGADGQSQASHLYAPFPDAAVAWSSLHLQGLVQHPTNPNWFRDSFLFGLYADDGAYIGTTRCAYDQLMYEDLIPFMAMRHNFDGFHYTQLENNLRLEMIGRDPSSGERTPDCVPEGSLGRAFMLYHIPALINPRFQDAGLYLWAKQTPTNIASSLDYLIDPSITPAPPQESVHVAPNYAILGGDLTDPLTVFLRSRVLASSAPHESGSALQYLGGDFTLVAHGERLVIDLGGYGSGGWAKLTNQNVIGINGVDDSNYTQVRGAFVSSYRSEQLAYARMETDLSLTHSYSTFKKKSVNQSRHIFFLNKEFYLLVDSLASASGVNDFDFFLHGSKGSNSAPGAFVKDLDNDYARWTRPSGVKLLARFISDVSLNSGDLVARDYIEELDQPYIAARMQGSLVDFVTLLYPSPAAGSEPGFVRFNGASSDAGELTTADGSTYIILVNRSGGQMSWGGVSTDGRIAVVAVDGSSQVKSFAVISGRQLSYNSTPLVNQLVVGDYFP